MTFSVIESHCDGAATIGRAASSAEAVKLAEARVRDYVARRLGPCTLTVFGPGERVYAELRVPRPPPRQARGGFDARCGLEDGLADDDREEDKA